MKNLRIISLALCTISTFFALSLKAQDQEIFNADFIHEIHISFSDSSFWQTLTSNYDNYYPDIPYIMADVNIDGEQVDSIGVRLKGFSSYWTATDKKSIKLDFNEFVKGKNYDGLKKINLNNGEGDPAIQRDWLCYDIFRKSGVQAPRTSYARVYLNNTFWGLYLVLEQIDKTYLKTHFESGKGNLFKNMGNSELKWEGSDPVTYQQTFDLKTGDSLYAWNRFVEFVDVINNEPENSFAEEIEKIFDVDRYLKILAVDVATNNWDSYIEHGRNFYIYDNPELGKFQWIPWDYNFAMGGTFSNDGGGPGVGQDPNDCLTIQNGSSPYPADDNTFQAVIFNQPSCCNTEWDQSCQELYDQLSAGNDILDTEECLTIINGSSPYPPTDFIFQEVIFNQPSCCDTEWDQSCQELYDSLSSSSNVDPNDCLTITNGSSPYPPTDPVFIDVIFNQPSCCDSEWDQSCQELYNFLSSGGNASDPSNCLTVLNGSSPYPPTDFVFQEVIFNQPSCCDSLWDQSCQLLYDQISEQFDSTGGGGQINFPVDMSQSNKILIDRILGIPQYREKYYQHWCELLDDNFVTSRLNSIIDKNGEQIKNDIAEDPNYMWSYEQFEADLDQGTNQIPGLKKFIADRSTSLIEELAALHNCTIQESSLNYQDVVINEFMASNDSVSTISDPNGEYDDWIELYNNTLTDIDLSNAYLTDNPSEPQKWKFPSGTMIGAEDYLIVWADKDPDQEGIHASFKLSKSGEFIMLSEYDKILDTISFGPQTESKSYARVPNGYGDFVIQGATFEYNNLDETTTPTDNPNLAGDLRVYPNPADDEIHIDINNPGHNDLNDIEIYDILGNQVHLLTSRSNTLKVSTAGLSSGLYLVIVNQRISQKLIIR